ncbi:MFS transporter [Chloroflexi bacterium TSY]|nr:MFS transporter [Chloroflexi bacterium TSY]
MNELHNLRKVLVKPDILSICLVVFCADIVMGMIVPTFSLFATGLGASLALVGALTGMMGLTSIFASVPVGVLSDLQGRKKIIVAGMLLFALSSFLYTVVPNPLLLFPVRILASLGAAAVFMVGVAYVGDVVPRPERGPALGLYSTAMALGFTIGPAIGGLVAERYGYGASYRVAAGIALIGLWAAMHGLASDSSSQPAHRQDAVSTTKTTLAAKLHLLVRDPGMLAASLANLGNNIAFTTIFSFLPLYAASLSIGDAMLGSMFASRGFASTCSRIPTGLLTLRTSGRTLMIAGLSLAALLLLVLAYTTSPFVLALLLIGDGIAYGLFLTAGQAHVTKLAAEEDRGRAMGVYTMAGSIGAAAGPLVMGSLAEWFGLRIVFLFAASFAILAAVTLWAVRGAGQLCLTDSAALGPAHRTPHFPKS